MASTPSPISTIPPEILTMIFKFVHAEHLAAHDLLTTQQPLVDDMTTQPSSIDDMRQTKRIRDLAKQPTFFPYAIATVCPFWEGVLSAVPEFWTRLVFFLDKQYTPIEKVKQYLSWSRDLPVDIYMTRRAELCPDPLYAEVLERYSVHRNMQCIIPQLHRCRALHVDVAMNTSLPVLPSKVPCETPLLRSITFECDVPVWNGADKNYTSLSGPDVPVLDYGDEDFTFLFQPKLRTFSVDGRNLHLAFAEEKPWVLEESDLKDLRIFQYDSMAPSRKSVTYQDDVYAFMCDETRLDLYQTLRMCQSFGSLVNLELDTVPFTISPSDVAENTFNFSRLNSLTLVKMAPETLQEIFRVCVFEDTEEMDRLVFVQCPRLNRVVFPLILTPELYLVGIDADVDFEPILQDWGGEILSISCCSNFSDAFLQRLATRQYHQSEHVVGEDFQFLCHEMTTLDLHFPDSTPYSVDALRKMVEARNYEVDYTDANWPDSMGLGPAITDLRAFGKVPELSQEDEEWFRSRLIHFSWGEAIVDTLWFVLSFAIRASN